MVKKVITGTNEDIHTLSDVKGSVYKKFQVKPHGTIGGIKMGYSSVHKIFKKKTKYYPYIDMKMIAKDKEGGNESKIQLPADFLIDENGIIVDLFRAKEIYDSMPFERIETFIPKEKRCKCNKKDCISIRCRENYEQIRKDAESMLYCG